MAYKLSTAKLKDKIWLGRDQEPLLPQTAWDIRRECSRRQQRRAIARLLYAQTTKGQTAVRILCGLEDHTALLAHVIETPRAWVASGGPPNEPLRHIATCLGIEAERLRVLLRRLAPRTPGKAMVVHLNKINGYRFPTMRAPHSSRVIDITKAVDITSLCATGKPGRTLMAFGYGDRARFVGIDDGEIACECCELVMSVDTLDSYPDGTIRSNTLAHAAERLSLSQKVLVTLIKKYAPRKRRAKQ